MYQGFPDFQQIVVQDDLQFIGAYQQADVVYNYPTSVDILHQESLAFTLDIIRSYSSESIYGKLNFTTGFVYPSTKACSQFNQTHPGTSINALPIKPYKLSFQAPTQLTDHPYEYTWYSTQNANFVIILNAETTQLIEKTLLNDIVTFNARLDGHIQGVSPRLNIEVEFDPKKLISELVDELIDDEDTDESEKHSGQYIFNYQDLAQYLFKHLDNLELSFTPSLKSSSLVEKQIISQTLLDRLYNQLGSPAIGKANSNTTFITLKQPSESGRLRINLNDVVLVDRPLCYLLNPFSAAQQLAKTSPDKVINKITAPKIPEGKIAINVFYKIPSGLSEDVYIDMRIIVPKGTLYPIAQNQTITLSPNSNSVQALFLNNNLTPNNRYQYQIRVNYSKGEKYQLLTTDILTLEGTSLVIDNQQLPCEFFSLTLDSNFSQESNLKGCYHTNQIAKHFELTQSAPHFSYPILSSSSYATASAISLLDKSQVELPSAIQQSTTIGAYSFTQFGSQKVNIMVNFPENKISVTILFQAQGNNEITQHTFTQQDNKTVYQWSATSIFLSRFRYKKEDDEKSHWSDYLDGNQTITIEVD